MKRFFVLLLLCCFHLGINAQNELSDRAEVSMLTCAPGDVLYTSFGHNAIRIKDPLSGLDKVYNYGTFDFNAPNFYLNFAKGNLIYMLSTTSFDYFLRVYDYEKRWMKEQILDLTPEEVAEFYKFLENNARPQNKNYRYDFFYDNCATRLEDVTRAVFGERVKFSNDHIETTKSHRDLIADYTQNEPWGKFGIDLALGAVIDDEATPDDYKFLPDYVFEAFEHAVVIRNEGEKPLVRSVKTLLNHPPIEKPGGLLAPMVVMSLIGIVIIALTYRDKRRKSRSRGLDFTLFLVTGLIGVAVLLLWFATTHTATYRNLNFLWAFAPNAIVAFYAFKKKLPSWIKFYLRLLLGLLLILVLLWVLGIQIFNLAMIPLLLGLAYRYWFLHGFSA